MEGDAEDEQPADRRARVRTRDAIDRVLTILALCFIAASIGIGAFIILSYGVFILKVSFKGVCS